MPAHIVLLIAIACLIMGGLFVLFVLHNIRVDVFIEDEPLGYEAGDVTKEELKP